MDLVRTFADLAAARAALPRPIGYVPTMGYLHAGHLALVAQARTECPTVVLSIFVNPAQFDQADDLARYPRDLDRDLALLQGAGVDLVFAPDAAAVYPTGFATTVRVGAITERLEGAHRAGHFDGVATVVAKLFNLVQPDRAYFGQKDAQQVAVVQKMVTDLNFPVTIVPVPTVREPDGLALSSRNLFLTGEARQQALTLHEALAATRVQWEQGERDADALRAAALARFAQSPAVRLDYLSLADAVTLEELHGPVTRGLLSTAAWVGSVRLIDNIRLE